MYMYKRAVQRGDELWANIKAEHNSSSRMLEKEDLERLQECVCVYQSEGTKWLLNCPSMPTSGFPYGSAGKESTRNSGDLGSIPGLGRFPGEGNCYPLQYSGLENSMDYTVHGVTKSQTRLSDFHFHFLFSSPPRMARDQRISGSSDHRIREGWYLSLSAI